MAGSGSLEGEPRQTRPGHHPITEELESLLADCGFTDDQAAEIMGWSKEHVGSIRKVYVDDTRVVMAIAERIAAKQKAKQVAQ